MPRTEHDTLALYHWNQLIQEACDYTKIELSLDCKNYLLMTLVRYIQNEDLADEAVKMTFFSESQSKVKNQIELLKTQADHCLILAGLFPAQLNRQSIRISHYIKLGSECFVRLSQTVDDEDRRIYENLSTSFVELVDVLFTIRAFNGSPAMPLIQAMELWSDTGSKMAYQLLTCNRTSIPLNETLVDHSYKH